MVRGLYIIFMFLSAVSAMYSSRAIEGYPAGYLSDCPSGDREAVISKKTLKHLTFTVSGKGNAKNTRYSYYQMKGLAKDPDMDFTKKTALYAGGYLDSPQFFFAPILATQYKKKGYNVLLLDTNKFTVMEYPLAVRYMRTVGKHVAEMLVNLTMEGLDPKKLEIVGLSLGGHTASFIGKNYKRMTGVTIGRITALDPAGLCFRNLGPDDRLDQSDADFVDIVDTNIDGYGMAAPVGHVNFYVNGGEFQPGDFLWMPCNILCSHMRSYTIWVSALQNPGSFIAMRCDSVQQAREKECYDNKPVVTNVLGLDTDRNNTGIFFLATHNNFPYFLGAKGLRKDYEFFSSHMKKIMDNDPMTM